MPRALRTGADQRGEAARTQSWQLPAGPRCCRRTAVAERFAAVAETTRPSRRAPSGDVVTFRTFPEPRPRRFRHLDRQPRVRSCEPVPNPTWEDALALTFAMEDVVVSAVRQLRLDVAECLEEGTVGLAGGAGNALLELADALVDLSDADLEMTVAMRALAGVGGVGAGTMTALALRVAAIPDMWRTPPSADTPTTRALLATARMQVGVEAVPSAAELLRGWVVTLAPRRGDDVIRAIAMATIRIVVDLAERTRILAGRVAWRTMHAHDAATYGAWEGAVATARVEWERRPIYYRGRRL